MESCFDVNKKSDLGISSELGGTVVFVALSLLSLFMLVSVVIDLSLLSESKERSQSFAQLATLSAVEQYFAVDKSLTETEKRVAATKRVNEVLATNSIIISKTVEKEGKIENGMAPNVVLYGVDIPTEKDAVLEPGRWYFVETEGMSECGGKPPCFVRSETTSESVNAFRLQGNFYRYVSSSFVRFVNGSDLMPVKVSTIATVIPRHGVFMIDLSPSVVRETHLLPEGAASIGVKPSEFGFTLSSENPHLTGLGATDAIWAGMDDTRPETPVADNYDKVHYKDDYISKKLLSDNEYMLSSDHKEHHPDPIANTKYASGNTNTWARVDAFRDPSYAGPEPLKTIFNGLKYAMESFDKRKVGGDKIGFMFYDDQLDWQRVVLPTSDFEYLKSLLDFDDGDLSSLSSDSPTIAQSDLIVYNKGLERIIRHKLFPSGNSFTNMRMALAEGMTMLANAESELVNSSDFLTFIGDGLTNCSAYLSPHCGNDYTHYQDSMLRLGELVTSKIIDTMVPIHVIMVGQEVGPHTVAVSLPSDGENKCLTDTEARLAGIPYAMGGDVNGHAFPTVSAASSAFDNRDTVPFYQTSFDMYEIARITGGVWAPIRPTSFTQDACPTVSCTPTLKRLTEDPLCRDYEAQIKYYIDKIISNNPYVIVDVDSDS